MEICFALTSNTMPSIDRPPNAGCYNLPMKKVVTKTTLNSQPSDLAYWLAQPVEARFAALETLRQQAHAHTPDAEQRLQRVYSVTQLKKR